MGCICIIQGFILGSQEQTVCNVWSLDMFTSQESKFEVVEKKGPNLKPKGIAHKQTSVSLCGSFIHAHSNV
jgi:hypothetical protein